MLVRTGFRKVTLGLLGPLEKRGRTSPSHLLFSRKSGTHFPAERCTAQSQGIHRAQTAGKCAGHAHPVCYPLEGEDHGYRCRHMSPSWPTELLPSVVAWWAVRFGERCLWGNGRGGRHVSFTPRITDNSASSWGGEHVM